MASNSEINIAGTYAEPPEGLDERLEEMLAKDKEMTDKVLQFTLDTIPNGTYGELIEPTPKLLKALNEKSSKPKPEPKHAVSATTFADMLVSYTAYHIVDGKVTDQIDQKFTDTLNGLLFRACNFSRSNFSQNQLLMLLMQCKIL